MVLVGMGQEHALDHLARHAVALELGKGLVQVEDVIVALLALAFGLGRRLDARVDEDSATRRPQVGTVAAAAAAEAHEAQPLAHPAVLRGLKGQRLRLQDMGRVVPIHVELDLERFSVVGISFIFMSSHIVVCVVIY